MRAVLAGSPSAGQNLNLLAAEEIIYSVGFFGLLYSAYTLVLDREIIAVGPAGRDTPHGIVEMFMRILRNRHIIRLVLTVAIALGIASGVRRLFIWASDRSTDRISIR